MKEEIEEETEEYELEETCINCNHFFPILLGEPTSMGICLKDEAFDPYFKELMEDMNYDCCWDLIEEKQYDGNDHTCPDFDPCEVYGEIDDDLAQSLIDMSKNPDKKRTITVDLSDPQSIIDQIDWKNMSFEHRLEEFQETAVFYFLSQDPN